jgi:hypothetical protein
MYITEQVNCTMAHYFGDLGRSTILGAGPTTTIHTFTWQLENYSESLPVQSHLWL